MSFTVYTYTISTDTLDGTSNLSKLRGEIEASSFAAKMIYLKHEDNMSDPPTSIEVWTDPALTGGEVTELDGIIAAHTASDPETQAGEEAAAWDEDLDLHNYNIYNVGELNGADVNSLIHQINITSQHWNVEVEAEAGTTSETFATRASITQDFEAGTYLIHWSMELRSDAGPNRLAQGRLHNVTLDETYSNTATPAFLLDVTFILSLLEFYRSEQVSSSGIKVVTLSGVNEIALQWRRASTLLGTAYISRARLFIQRIS